MDQHCFYIYGNFDYSQLTAGSTRMLYYAKALADKGHKVYMVTCCSDKLADGKFIEIEPNVYVLDKKNPTNNFFRTLAFLRDLSSFAERKKGGKTFIHQPSLLVFLEILSLLYFKGYKKYAVYCELNEINKHTSSFHAPFSIRNINYSLQKAVFKSVFTLMEPLLCFYDGLICISTSMVAYGSRFNKNTLRIPILTDPDIIIEKSDNTYFTQRGI